MDDLISRQAVLDMLEDINNHINDGCKYRHDWCVDWVNGLPSVHGKHGKWVVKSYDKIGGYWAECTVCHRLSFGGGEYCSMCGARMDGEQSE